MDEIHANKVKTSNWLGELGIKFAIIQTSSFKPMLRQLLANDAIQGRGQSAASNLESRPFVFQYKPYRKIKQCENLARAHSIILLALYFALAFKYVVVELIKPGRPLDNYQFLDCLLVGRLKLVGRTGRLSGPLAAFLLLYFAAYRLWVLLLVPQFKFKAYEFLLTDFEDVPEDEESPSSSSSVSTDLRFNSIIYSQDHWQTDSKQLIIRRNRTRDSWLLMSWWTRLMLFISVAYFVIWTSLISYLLAGSFFTDLGFEMSYSTCVSWLRDQQRGNSTSRSTAPYSYIYQAPQVLASEMSLEQIPVRVPFSLEHIRQFNWYQLVRLVADIVENYFIYTEFTLCFLGHLHILTINTVDILHNAAKIKSMLKSLIEHQVVKRSRVLSTRPNVVFWSTELIRPKTVINSSKIASGRNVFYGDLQLAKSQAILVDHFKLIKAHNSYASFFYVFLFAGWLLYTVIVCIWMAQIRSRAVEFEFALVEIACSLLCVSYFVGSNMIYSSGFHLHNLVATLMASDSPHSETKPRWLTILMHYFPRPLYCITIFGYFEISWLFSLKLIFWVVSAFVVLASFLYGLRR